MHLRLYDNLRQWWSADGRQEDLDQKFGYRFQIVISARHLSFQPGAPVPFTKNGFSGGSDQSDQPSFFAPFGIYPAPDGPAGGALHDHPRQGN